MSIQKDMREQSLKDLCVWINDQFDEFELDENGKCKIALRAMVGNIVRRCVAEDWAYPCRMTWDMLGVDASNRYGDGLDAERVHKLILAFSRRGGR